jgi:hypothetical protein
MALDEALLEGNDLQTTRDRTIKKTENHDKKRPFTKTRSQIKTKPPICQISKRVVG